MSPSAGDEAVLPTTRAGKSARNTGVAAQPRLRILTQGMNHGRAFDQIVIVRIKQRFEGHAGQPSVRLDHQRSSRREVLFHRSDQRLVKAASVPAQGAEL